MLCQKEEADRQLGISASSLGCYLDNFKNLLGRGDRTKFSFAGVGRGLVLLDLALKFTMGLVSSLRRRAT